MRRSVRAAAMVTVAALPVWSMAQTAPEITQAPASQTVVLGQNATFSVSASGTAPLSYQWYRGTTPIAGATSASYTLTNVQLGDAGIYAVEVTNSVGSARTYTGFGPAFSAGYMFSLFTSADGTLWGVGNNYYGQLGDGTTNTRFLPVQIATGVTAVSTGAYHALFLKSDGTLWGMGNNGAGQLGDGSGTNRLSPVQIASGVAAIAAGGNHSLFLKTDGTLWATGYNYYGQLGDGSSSNRLSPVSVASNVRTIAAAGSQSYFVKTDGTLWAMGNNYYGSLGDGTSTHRYLPVQVATGVDSVSAGNLHMLFVKTDGTLWGTGYNYNGPLGTGTSYGTYYSPVMIDSRVATAAAGYDHSLYVRTDGSLWGMGGNSYGQLGDGTNTNRYAPVAIASSVATVSGGYYHSFFRPTDGSLLAMGYGYYGQLGDAGASNRNTPGPVLKPGDRPALLTVIVPPTVTVLSAPESVTAGGSVTMSVSAAGTAPFSYQWKKDGVDLAGATASTLTLSSASIDSAGVYSIAVTNAAGSVTQTVTTLGFAVSLLAEQTAISGKEVAFRAQTGGRGSVTWQISTDNGTTWTDLTDGATYAGVHSTMLEILQPTAAMNNFLYRYVVTNGQFTATSPASKLTVIASPLGLPVALVVDKSGHLYVTDAATHTVAKIGADLKLSVIAGQLGQSGAINGIGTSARFNEPGGFVLADDGSLVLADTGNNTIRSVSAVGLVNTVAGTGAAGAVDAENASATFYAPVGMSADLAGNYLVADQSNHLVRMISGGRVTTLAGRAGSPGFADGVGTAAGLNLPTGIVVRRDTFGSMSWSNGNNGYGTIFVSDQGSNTIRVILPNGQVGTYLGAPSSAGATNGSRTAARFNKPTGLAMDGDGNLYIADTGNHTIRKVDTTGFVTTFAGVPTVSGLADGSAAQALFNAPEALAFDGARNLYIADTGNGAIRKITPAGVVSTLAVVGNVPVIATQPASVSVNTGGSASFSVSATGEGTLTYQWKKNNVDIAGATNATYTLSSVASTDAASYSVVVTNSWGSTTSSLATLTITTPPPPPSNGGATGGSGSGGGGGAPSWVFIALAGAASAFRFRLVVTGDRRRG
ncbi:MAG: immunoglobulin domain-containing protein [Opitutae bacterium]|nr:immunoglobulin domain-containing protein [Opitutae bacterium]